MVGVALERKEERRERRARSPISGGATVSIRAAWCFEW